MIYKEATKKSNVCLINDNFKNRLDEIIKFNISGNVVVVTDPPFNIGYHYNEYKDKMSEEEYYSMLVNLVNLFPSVFIHYPEALHKLSIKSGIVPSKVCSWVYNSNTAKQHRDIVWYKVNPCFTNTKQPYKNLNDKRIQARIENGCGGGRMYDWWNINQIKNVSKEKTSHPCQMPLEVMKNVVSTLPYDSIVFDPFMGSGTTGKACIELGYDFIGCEINNDYYEIAKTRLTQEDNFIEVKI